MTNPSLWNQLFVWPILNLLVAFYRLCETVGIPGPLGFAIILLTIAIRLILAPLMQAQLKSAKKMSDLKPHMDELSKRHKDDKQALQQAQLSLYKEHGVNPAAGCLPLLVQFPVLIALYSVFNTVLSNANLTQVVSDINTVVYLPILKLTTLDLSFFGTTLTVKPSEWQTRGWWLLSIPLITGLLQWYQSKLMLPAAAKASEGKPSLSLVKNKDKKEEKSEDTAAEMQKQMALITPIMFGYFAFQFPLGLALYWNVFGLFGIMQQKKVNKG